VPVKNFLSQRAVNIVVTGSYTLPNWYNSQGKLRTFACRTTRVSPFRMIVEVPVVGKIGDRLTSYFREFGKFEGSISDTMERSFLLELEMTRARREKLSDMLTWLEKKQKDPTIKDAEKTGAHCTTRPAFHADPGGWFYSRMLHRRYLIVRGRGFGRRAAAHRHAAGGRNVSWPRRPTAAQWFRCPIHRAAKFQGPGPSDCESASSAVSSRSRLVAARHVWRNSVSAWMLARVMNSLMCNCISKLARFTRAPEWPVVTNPPPRNRFPPIP
jgi:hypothetical protein